MADRYNRDAAVREKVERALDDLFAQVLAWGGVITGEHGIGLAKNDGGRKQRARWRVSFIVGSSKRSIPTEF